MTSRRPASVRLGAAALVAGFLAGISGCGCTERVTVRNATDRPVQVQIALPWPSYTGSGYRGCHFDFVLAPDEVWATETSNAEERVALPIAQPNGVLLVRTRRIGMGNKWTLSYLSTSEPLSQVDPVSISIRDSGVSGLIVQARDRNGRAVSVKDAQRTAGAAHERSGGRTKHFFKPPREPHAPARGAGSRPRGGRPRVSANRPGDTREKRRERAPGVGSAARRPGWRPPGRWREESPVPAGRRGVLSGQPKFLGMNHALHDWSVPWSPSDCSQLSPLLFSQSALEQSAHSHSTSSTSLPC